ncbi:hypothetical protein ACGFNF_03370 [Micromonospora sp. NPDC048868]|uniref:hypothetical protein n=1 Tax=Micromonospora sp. NPDC048868 TaxID=3364258 RepID=UPI003718FE13
MSALLQQLPTLAGVLIGALGSYLVSTSAERSRWRREHQARWGDMRAAAYANYAGAVKELFQLTLEVDARRHRGADSSASPDDLVRLQAADAARAAKWETVLLVGTPQAVEAARQWHRTIWSLVGIVSEDSYDVARFAQALELSGPARSNFYEAARRDLGLVGESLHEVDYSTISSWITQRRPKAEPNGVLP